MMKVYKICMHDMKMYEMRMEIAGIYSPAHGLVRRMSTPSLMCWFVDTSVLVVDLTYLCNVLDTYGMVSFCSVPS